MAKLRQQLLEDAIDMLGNAVHGMIRNGAPQEVHDTFASFERKWMAYKHSEPDPDAPPKAKKADPPIEPPTT